MSCEQFKQGDWAIFDDYEDTLICQVEWVKGIEVGIVFEVPAFREAGNATVNRHYLTKITKEVADIMRGV